MPKSKSRKSIDPMVAYLEKVARTPKPICHLCEFGMAPPWGTKGPKCPECGAPMVKPKVRGAK